MSFLPLTNLGKKLRPKYRLPITALIFAFLVASLVSTGLFAFWLADALGIKNHVPLKGQPHEFLFEFLLLGVFIFFVVLFYLASFGVLAAVLRWFYGWPPERIRELIMESRIPPHWLK